MFGTDKGTVVEHSNLVKASIIPAADGSEALHSTPACTASGISTRVGASTGACRGRSFRSAWGIEHVITMDTYGHLFPRGDDAAEIDAAERDGLDATRRDMLAKR